MKHLFAILSVALISLTASAQGYNAKEGSHRGYGQPTQQEPSSWSGSGIALGPKIFATNNHVVDGATHLYVYFPETQKKYVSQTLAVDETNDLAIVKITDPSFTGFPSIKYGFKTDVEDVGTSVFVLGYPLVDTMGEEVKLTTGVVSSRSGYQGDKSQYQVSAPVQPGNSGGPMFNSKGELIGIISAKHTEADNVSYGVKLSYLSNLASSNKLDIDLTKSTQISSLSLSEKCKAVIPCTIMVLADNSRTQTDSQTSPATSEASPRTPSSGSYPIHCNMPEISSSGNAAVKIYAIEITQEFTAVYMTFTNAKDSYGWFNIQENTYIVDKSTGKQYPLQRAVNCALYPDKTHIDSKKSKDFILYFPSLPANVSTIDLCEPGTSSNWKFYGIRIQ